MRLWHKIETREDPEWERRYLSTDPNELAFGGRVEVHTARRHRSWWTRWRWRTRIRSARSRSSGRTTSASSATLTDGIITPREANRFLEAAQDLPRLKAGELHGLNVALPAGTLAVGKPGIF